MGVFSVCTLGGELVVSWWTMVAPLIQLIYVHLELGVCATIN